MYSLFLRDENEFAAGFDFDAFCGQFNKIQFKGVQTVKCVPHPDNKGGYVTTVQSATSDAWKNDIL